MFPTFWFCCDTSSVSTSGGIYWPECQLNLCCEKFPNRSQCRRLDPTFNCVNKFTPSVSIFLMKHLSEVWTFTFLIDCWNIATIGGSRFCVNGSVLTTTFSWPPFAGSPKFAPWSKSSNWLKSLLSCGFFFQNGTMFTITNDLYL